jgi:hypothetical protein
MLYEYKNSHCIELLSSGVVQAIANVSEDLTAFLISDFFSWRNAGNRNLKYRVTYRSRLKS